MGYTESFKNTFALDVLEILGVVNLGILHEINEDPCSNSTSCSSYTANNMENIDKDALPERHSGSKHERLSNVSSGKIDPFLVTWTGPNDPDLPLNWSTCKKTIVVSQVMLLTCVTYMGASIYTPGQEDIQKQFHVGHVVGTLNMSMYVLGYGIGPMIFSPLSEVSTIGRQQIYTITFFMFMTIQVGAATVQNIGGLIIIRFFSGILCSPPLATGAASMADIVGSQNISKFVGLWAVGCLAAPIIAPLLGACMVVAKNWRYIFWLMMWVCALTSITLAFFFPETHHENILHRKAYRLRKSTGDSRFYTKREKIDCQMKTRKFISDTFYRPFQIIVLEASVLAFDVYTALAYGAFYLFFEAFPIVFGEIYCFTLVEQGLAYMGFCVGCLVAYAVLYAFIVFVIDPKFKKGTFRPESFLLLPMWVCWGMPFSLFFFGWTAGIHWILPMIAQVFFVLNVFNLFQCSFSYLAICFPRYVASVMAGNGLFRAGFACAFPLFGKALYKNLGSKQYPVGWGSSLVGFFGTGLAIVPFLIYKNGAKLRGKSRFSG
ncbi:hypothetical protein BZL39_K05350 [Zygosaccharomyces parabailii]|nr:hypothetical protein BZL39_K05350 [Zygosaccharomyces parabailii]